MTSALIYFGGSLFVVTILTILFKVEDSYGDRIILGGVRDGLDRLVVRCGSRMKQARTQGSVNFIRLTWHYIIHTFLKRVQLLLRRLQAWSEGALKRNKEVAKEIRKTTSAPTHFEAISAHKEKVALTPEERAERKSR